MPYSKYKGVLVFAAITLLTLFFLLVEPYIVETSKKKPITSSDG